MSTRFDQPATMPKLRPTPKSPSSKKARRKERIERERQIRRLIAFDRAAAARRKAEEGI